jgi:hypothetical protein
MRKFTFLSLMLGLFLSLNAVTFGQETTGIIEVTVKDPQGAVVPNVSITVASAEAGKTTTAGFRRTAVSDDNGFQRFLQVPPGVYTVTTAATSGFGERVVQGVQVVLGKATPVNVDLGVGQQTATVDINTDDVSPIDTTDTKIQTNVTAQTAELLPKGTNFTSVLKVSPATRPEQGGFQIDGASSSENTFIVDGHEVTNAVKGNLNANNDLPFNLVQEVQIKSSGFEAEYGGATGGVINVVTRGGGNEWRGEFGVSFRPNDWQGTPNPTQYLAGPTSAVYLDRPNDGGVAFFPTANFSGPIIKDKLWFLASYSPQIFESNRTINYRSGPTSSVVTRSERYDFKQKNEYGFLRLDAQPLESLRLSGTFTWNPIAQRGELPGLDTQFSALPSGNGLVGPAYQNQLGGRQNSNITTGQAVWTPRNNLVLSARYGYNFLNQKLGNYGRPDVLSTFRVLCSGASLGQPPANAGCTLGQSNGVTAFINTVKDVTTRENYDADATVLFGFGGRHELKGGYQRTELSNDLLAPATDQIVLRFGTPIATYSGRPVSPTAGQIGSGSVIRQSSQGFVTSKNEAFFVQDKWQPTSRLTLNLGLRTEREDVPSYSEGGEDIKFGFSDKFAPRLGVAYDLTGDGKTKVSAFYGWFYDRFKYELPRGLFGGEVLRQAFFELFPADFNNNALTGGFTPAALLGGLGFQIGGSCPTTGTLAGRIRCELDFRIPVNTTLGPEFGFIDPDIEPYRQSELSFTFERELTNNFVFLSRYTRKNLDRAIEDVGFINSEGGESYIITNPGYNAAADFYTESGFTPVKAVRKYDALEFRVERRFADNYYFNANYTWSRLVGNYSGLASSDEYGRQSPNANRFFDGPLFGYTLEGGPDEGGRLATDRPHTFKLQGAYSLDWNDRFGWLANNTTEFQVFQIITSGTPNTSFADISSFDTLVISRRGDLGRLETFTQTDFAVRHRYRFGRDNRFTLVGEVDILNLFDERNELDRYTLINNVNYDPTDPDFGLVTQAEFNSLITPQNPNGTLTFAQLSILAQRRYQQNGAPLIIADINSGTKDPRFNTPNVWQAPREIRFGFRFIF